MGIREDAILKREIEGAIFDYGMQCAKNKVIIGFSGGADSSALLHYFSRVSKQIVCVHINHMIRGEEADRDEAFCKSVCEKYGVEFVSYKIDIPTLAKQRSMGVEETAREERYRVFFEECERRGFDAILTAHNANDNTESVLFNLVRGSGANGLSGIKPVNGKIMRPLIYVTRESILQYCRDNEIEFVTDSTNFDTDYTRNYIRHEIVPMLEKLNPSLNSAVSRLTSSLRLDEEYINGVADAFVKEHCEGGKIIPSDFEALPKSVKVRVLKIVSQKNLDAKAIDFCIGFMKRNQSGDVINLCKGVSLKMESGYATFIKTTELEDVEFSVVLNEGLCEIEGIGIAIAYNTDVQPKDKELYCTLCLDKDAIQGTPVARSRKEGDIIYQGKLSKKIKKLFCEKKIPSHIRKRIPIICDDNGIVAIPNVAIRDGAKGEGITIRFYKGVEKC